MNALTKAKLINFLFFQGFIKWGIALAITFLLFASNPATVAQMSKPTIVSYPITNCSVDGELMMCHK